MIILIGPDGTGKTAFAKKLAIGYSKPYYHFTKDSDYRDYIPPLTKLEMTDAVLDRCQICEYPYSIVMKRPFKFTMKQWHNMMIMTLIQKPVIVLMTHKPTKESYPSDQYMPYHRWDECLRLHRDFLTSNRIKFSEIDYSERTDYSTIIKEERANNESMLWWRTHFLAGYGCAGSPYPKFLVVAERQGPSNRNNIPFEAGPTGYMLSRVIYNTKTPLGVLAITNMVKSHRGDSRKVNDQDGEFLHEELVNLKPEKVIFMGTPSRQGIPIAKELGIDTDTIVHLGALNHRGVKDLTGYCNEWRKMLGIVPTRSFS